MHLVIITHEQRAVLTPDSARELVAQLGLSDGQYHFAAPGDQAFVEIVVGPNGGTTT